MLGNINPPLANPPASSAESGNTKAHKHRSRALIARRGRLKHPPPRRRALRVRRATTNPRRAKPRALHVGRVSFPPVVLPAAPPVPKGITAVAPVCPFVPNATVVCIKTNKQVWCVSGEFLLLLLLLWLIDGAC
jgi:hypothetical protein